MEYIDIISKEPIMQGVAWPAILVAALFIAALFSVVTWAVFTNRMCDIRTGELIVIIGVVGISILLLVMAICSLFFRVPTGRYKYQAMIDKDKITVSQYEEFIEKYNPIIKDGIYYWEE